MLCKLSSGQRMPFEKMHFWSCDLSDWLKCHRRIFRQISKGYCIHLPNMKRINLMAAKLLQKENADPAVASPIHKQAGRLIMSEQQNKKTK